MKAPSKPFPPGSKTAPKGGGDGKGKNDKMPPFAKRGAKC